jgi:acylphosphatase
MEASVSTTTDFKKMIHKSALFILLLIVSSCHPQPRIEGPIESLTHVEDRIQELRELEDIADYDQVTIFKRCPQCNGDHGYGYNYRDGEIEALAQERAEIEELRKKIKEREEALLSQLYDPEDGSQHSIKRRFIAAKEIRLERNKKARGQLASLILAQQEYWHDEQFRNELYTLSARYDAAAAEAKHRMQKKYKKTFKEKGRAAADEELITNAVFY